MEYGKKKKDWIYFAVIGAFVLLFLVYTGLKAEYPVSYDEAKELISFTEEESTFTVHLNVNGGVVYIYNDAHFGADTGDSIYIQLRMSLFDRWFGKSYPSWARRAVAKDGDADKGYTLPKIWYIENDTDLSAGKTAIEIGN